VTDHRYRYVSRLEPSFELYHDQDPEDLFDDALLATKRWLRDERGCRVEGTGGGCDPIVTPRRSSDRRPWRRSRLR
jgi:hypothetical protein